MIMTHTARGNWSPRFTLHYLISFLVLPICSRWLKFIPPPPSCHVLSVLLDFRPSAHKMVHLVAYDAWKGLFLRTARVGAHADRAPVAAATNLNCDHVPQLQMSCVKNAVGALQDFGR